MTTTKRLTGTVKTVNADRGFGFISVPGRPKDLFFHTSDFTGEPFDEQLTRRRGSFVMTETDKGPAARDVKPEP